MSASYADYIRALTRHFDDPEHGGAARMGLHQMLALEEVRPDLHQRALERFGPAGVGEAGWARPEVEEWLGEHWNEET